LKLGAPASNSVFDIMMLRGFNAQSRSEPDFSLIWNNL